jgi:DNA-binding transcriptional MerR regulator
MTDENKVKSLKPDKLNFDLKNPRMAEYGISPTATDKDIIVILWDAMDVRELVMSISASGFFVHETLIVAIEKKRYVVIEGNRRLAAVKVLLHPELRQDGWNISAISEEVKATLQELPVTISDRQAAWRFLGFKHVNGPAKWTSYAKARYIADVHSTYDISLSTIAQQIGDVHRTVQRLYSGLMVIEQAEREGVYDREDRFRKHLAFSHLYTGLSYDGIRNFLSLCSETEETDTPVPAEKKEQLGQLCVWLYGSKKENKPPVVQTQNPHLRQLNAILKSPEAIVALRDGANIDTAFEISRPPTAIFEEALLRSKRELTRAKANLATGYDRSEGLLRIAGSIATIADSIYEEMDRMRSPKKKVRLTEE